MLENQNDKNKKWQPDLRPSRFLVDLKSANEPVADKESSIEKFENLLFKLDKAYLKKGEKGKVKEEETVSILSAKIIIEPEDLQRLADKIFITESEVKIKNYEVEKKIVSEKLSSFKAEIISIAKKSKLLVGPEKYEQPGQALIFLKKLDERFGSLAFYFLFRVALTYVYQIFKIFFRFCYGLGWLVVFLVKFIALFIYRITLPIGHLFGLLNISPTQIIIKVIYLISGSFEKIGKFIRYIAQQPRLAFEKLYKKLSIFLIANRKQEPIVVAVNNDQTFEVEKSIITTKQAVKEKISQFEWRDLLPRPTFSSARNAIPFAIILLVIILPIAIYLFYGSVLEKKGEVLGTTELAVNDFLVASQSTKTMDFNLASQKFSEASNNFLVAQAEIKSMSLFFSGLSLVIPSQDLKMAAASNNILKAGQITGQIGSQISQALAGLFSSEKDLMVKLDNFSKSAQIISAEAKELTKNIVAIDPSSIPEEYRDKFILIKSKSTELGSNLAEFNDLLEKLKIFLGASKDKRYLFVFQNNAELRASGGFIGSFALVDFKEGKIKNIEVPGGGTYDTEAGLFERMVSPEPLHIVNPLWHLWDSNWWPDWPKSARKLMWFYEKSAGPTVDGVISLTPTVVENALRVIGPIDMTAEYGVVIDSDNFWKVAQEYSEQKPNVTKKPKKFIGDLMNKIIAELPLKLNKDTLINLVATAEQSLAEKQILFYFTDPELEKKITEYGWDGGIKETTSDYLAVINTNIAGGKSDKKIEQTINHKAVIMNDGSVIDEVTVKRVHTGLKHEDFSGVRNVDYMRFYVPAGSELLAAQGFSKPDNLYFEMPDPSWKNDPDLADENAAKIDAETGTKIYQENGKTVFANWSQVDPASSTELYIKYRLPFKVQPIVDDGKNLTLKEKIYNWFDKLLAVPGRKIATYSLLTQKQSGAIGVTLESQELVDSDYNIIWRYPKYVAENNIDSNNSAWQIKSDLNEDKFFLVALEIKKNNNN